MIDLHLPISSTLVKFAKTKIEPHNPDFVGSRGWFKKFSASNNLSLRSRTSSQKLSAQLEKNCSVFLVNVSDFCELGGMRWP